MKVVKAKGPIVTAVVAGLAMVGVVGAFASNASPYVTVDQARNVGGDSLHLAGTLVKDSCQRDFKSGHLTFRLKDKNGVIVEVEHMGTVPASLLEATQVVAIGAMRGSRFVSNDLLVKCPSKYDEKVRDPLAAKP